MIFGTFIQVQARCLTAYEIRIFSSSLKHINDTNNDPKISALGRSRNCKRLSNESNPKFYLQIALYEINPSPDALSNELCGRSIAVDLTFHCTRLPFPVEPLSLKICFSHGSLH